MTKEMTPLSQLGPDAPLYLASAPQGVDLNKIELNASRFNFIRRAGRLGRITIRHYEETNKIDSTPVPPEQLVLTEHLQLHDKEIGFFNRPYIKPAAEIGIDYTALTPRISRRLHQGESQEEAWAHELDTTLRRSLRQLMIAVAIGFRPKNAHHESVVAPFLWATSLLTAPFFINGPSPVINGAALHASVQVATLLAEKYNGYRLSERSWSISPLPILQLDRLAVGALASTPPRLIRYSH